MENNILLFFVLLILNILFGVLLIFLYYKKILKNNLNNIYNDYNPLNNIYNRLINIYIIILNMFSGSIIIYSNQEIWFMNLFILVLNYTFIISSHCIVKTPSKLYNVFFLKIMIILICFNILLINNIKENVLFINTRLIGLFIFQSTISSVIILYIYMNVYYYLKQDRVITLTNIIIDNNNDNDCPICLEKLKTEQTIETECKHNFHRECLYKSFERNFLCPICRRNLQKRNLII
jgi:hypothetical protein